MVPALLLDMPDDFEVKFTPRYPLGVGYPLLMRVRRMHGRVSKNSLRFHSGATVDKGPRVRCRTMSCANGCPPGRVPPARLRASFSGGGLSGQFARAGLFAARIVVMTQMPAPYRGLLEEKI